MTLSTRQRAMLVDLSEAKDGLLTANALALKHSLSIRTVQNDLVVIKEEISKLSFLKLESIPSKGNHLEILDDTKFQEYLKAEDQLAYCDQLNFRENRIRRVIAILLCTKKSISLQHLADRLFVSKSTCLNDLKVAKDTLSTYHITIRHQASSGISIQGSEQNIRKCISMEHIELNEVYHETMSLGQTPDRFRKIGNFLVNLFTEYRYRISDVALQNLIVHLDVFIRRIEMGFVMEQVEDEEVAQDFSRELEMSRKLFEDCHRYFQTPIIEAEVLHLAIYLRGKSDYNDDSYITQEIDDFVLESLSIIKQKFGMDLMDHMQLRVSLSLHLIPLLTRLKYNMQVKNELLSSMRKNYQVALDIASSFSYHIQEVFGYTLIEDEISYLAIYFNSALDSQQMHEGTNKVLIISSLKRSETLLLRERINSWFAKSISELLVEDIYHLKDLALESFDVICTTEQNQFVTNGVALLISQFPTDEDYRKIKMALDGFDGKKELLSLFPKHQVLITKTKNKQSIIKELCDLIGQSDVESSELRQEVMKREAMGGTYFGNQVAMPHPMYPLSEQTSIAVALLEEDITWDDYGSQVSVIVLVSIQRNNPKAYRIWSYLTEFITNERFVKAVQQDVSYENFIAQLSLVLDTMNWKLHEV